MTDLIERERQARAKADTSIEADRKAAFLEWSELHDEVVETVREAIRPWHR